MSVFTESWHLDSSEDSIRFAEGNTPPHEDCLPVASPEGMRCCKILRPRAVLQGSTLGNHADPVDEPQEEHRWTRFA